MMPRYDFLCTTCNRIFERVCHIDECKSQYCPDCKSLCWQTFVTPPSIQSSYVDNHLYNNGRGYFDEALKCHINTRGERDRKMKELGVVPLEMGREEFEDSLKPKPARKASMEDLKDAYDRGKAKLSQGWRPETEEQLLDRIRRSTGTI